MLEFLLLVGGIVMTLKELSERFEISETSILNVFPRVQKSMLKKHGLHLTKKGRGANAQYFIEEEEEEEIPDDCRALTMYEEIKDDIIISDDSLKLMNVNFLVFLAIVTTPMLVFRGSFEEFLIYVGAKPTKKNILALKGALNELEEEGYISYTLDKTDLNYFVAALYRKVEEKMHIGINMIRTCKKIAVENNKRSWVPLLKTWLGIQMMAQKESFRIETLESITGLSAYQVRESRKLLERNEIYRMSRVYQGYNTCLGSKVELNGIYNKK